MKLSSIAATLMAISVHANPFPAVAQEKAVVDAIESYLDFVEYGGATIFPEQIPKDEWKKFFVIDARDKDSSPKSISPTPPTLNGAVFWQSAPAFPRTSRYWCTAIRAHSQRRLGLRFGWQAMKTSLSCRAVSPSGKPKGASMPPPGQQDRPNTKHPATAATTLVSLIRQEERQASKVNAMPYWGA